MSDHEYSEGDEVVLADTHHMHNPELKRNEGRKGEIIGTDHGHDGKLHIEFEGTTNKIDNRWRVARKWVKPATDSE